MYWSYNTNFNAAGTATTGTVATSPVISLDGTKLAFVETRTAANGGSILHLLKWHASDGRGRSTPRPAPKTATVWTADGAAGHCPTTGACLISLVFNGAQPDTGSSPFYDYLRDALYVGDDNGVLHKFINAFGVSGTTPSEVVTGKMAAHHGCRHDFDFAHGGLGIGQHFPGRFGREAELRAGNPQHRGDMRRGCGTLPRLDGASSLRRPT